MHPRDPYRTAARTTQHIGHGIHGVGVHPNQRGDAAFDRYHLRRRDGLTPLTHDDRVERAVVHLHAPRPSLHAPREYRFKGGCFIRSESCFETKARVVRSVVHGARVSRPLRRGPVPSPAPGPTLGNGEPPPRSHLEPLGVPHVCLQPLNADSPKRGIHRVLVRVAEVVDVRERVVVVRVGFRLTIGPFGGGIHVLGLKPRGSSPRAPAPVHDDAGVSDLDARARRGSHA